MEILDLLVKTCLTSLKSKEQVKNPGNSCLIYLLRRPHVIRTRTMSSACPPHVVRTRARTTSSACSKQFSQIQNGVLSSQRAETALLKTKLFSRSNLLQPPKGVLLYGPPGCGKTMIAKAMAKASGARFINLQVSSLVDKWYGESQKRSEAVFSLAVKIQPTIIFIDEIDSFLRSRTSTDHEATAMMKTQFMSFWDGLMTDSNRQIMIVGATNRPQDVDAAIQRRMPSMFCIGLPSLQQRIHILNLILLEEGVSEDIDLEQLAQKTEGFSGSDLRELCRNAMIYRVRDYIRSEQQKPQLTESSNSIEEDDLRPLEMDDLLSALHKIRQSRLVSLVAAQQIDLD